MFMGPYSFASRDLYLLIFQYLNNQLGPHHVITTKSSKLDLAINASRQYTFPPITSVSSYSLTTLSPTDVFISDNSWSMQSAADFPASRYKLIEGNQCLSIQLACICLRPACLQHS